MTFLHAVQKKIKHIIGFVYSIFALTASVGYTQDFCALCVHRTVAQQNIPEVTCRLWKVQAVRCPTLVREARSSAPGELPVSTTTIQIRTLVLFVEAVAFSSYPKIKGKGSTSLFRLRFVLSGDSSRASLPLYRPRLSLQWLNKLRRLWMSVP